MRQNEHGEGWFYGYSPVAELDFIDDDTHRVRNRDSKNVIGRFIDHDIIDGVASREAKKAVFRPRILLEMKNLRVPSGTGQSQGTDVATSAIRFDQAYKSLSIEAIQRFPEAWKAYQDERKTPVTDEEREALEDAGIEVKAVRKPRKPRAKKNPENVVDLKKASA